MVKSKLLNNFNYILNYFGDKNDSLNLEKLNVSGRDIVTAQQIHSNTVVIIKDKNKKDLKHADGMATNQKIILGIRTADCLPVFLFDPTVKVITAVHAGWKGLSEGILQNAVFCMKKLGSNPMEILVSIGPHIQACCYSVGEDLLQKFPITNKSEGLHLLSADLFSEFRLNSWYLNLGRIAMFQLESLGINHFQIELSKICTSCDNNYWSFRRDRKKAGRMLNLLGII